MKIVFVLPNMGSGGAERVVSILSRDLVNNGYSVDIAMLFSDKCQYKISSSVECKSFELLNKSRFFRYKSLRNYFKNLKQSYGDVVTVPFQDSCLNYVLLSTFGLGVKIVATERSNPYRKGKSLVSRFKASIPFILSNHSVFQTPDARNYYLLLLKSHCSVICNPIIATTYKWKGDISASKLISVCRLHQKKNVEMTLNVLLKLKDKYPDIHLNIYGEGSQLEKLQKVVKIKCLETHVSFCGITKDIISKLIDSSIYISTSDEEGISNSMLEAMSVGMPVICTDCPIGGAKMMLKDGAGLLSPIGDVDSFAYKLDYLLSNKEQAEIIGNQACLKTQHNTPSKIFNQWESILMSLVKY